MAKLVWGAEGERQFEAGCDRGVLYLPGEPGVAWTGLKAVRESPIGGEPQPYYIDGLKYANIAAAEEFAATINAFSSPKEFAACDGSVMLAAGLFATQQPRKEFGLSYRTRVGDDINGVESGYKIHLVYNALASASDRPNTTMSNSIAPLDLSWSITTRPPTAFYGYKPTSHLVITTKDLDLGILAELESILYGDDISAPMLIGQVELRDLLS